MSAETTGSLSAFFPPLVAADAGTIDADRVLVGRCQRGDRDAFALLVSRHQRLVFNLAYRLLDDYDAASDIAQDTFLSAWRNLASFRGDARLSTWLYKIAYNLCLKRLEARRRDADASAALGRALAEAPSVATTDAAVERRAAVHDAIAALPIKYKSVIVLFYLRDLDYEEIARFLDLPLGTVKTHLYRARQLLKEALA